ncbi:MAG: TolC family protein [Chitinophagales bacterium]
MNKLFILTCLISGFNFLQAQDIKSFSLKNAIEYSINHNDAFQNVKIDEEIRTEFTKENTSIGMPQISGKLDYNYAFEQAVSIIPAGTFGPTEQEAIFSQPHTVNASFQATQLIFDSRYFLGLKATKSIKHLASLNTQLNKSNLEKDVALAYYGVVVTKNAYTKLQENEKILEKLLTENKEMYKEGLIDELTVNRLELNLSNLQTSISQTKINYDNALANFKFTIGLNNDEEVLLTDNLETLVAESNTALAQEGKPQDRVELQMMQAQDELNNLNIKQTLSNYAPNMYAFVNYGTSAQRDEFNFFDKGKWFQNGMLGFNLNVPIFDGLKAHYQAQQIKLEKQKNLNNIETFEKQYELQVTTARNNLMEAQNQLESQTENRNLAEKIFYKTNLMFSEGLGSSFELSQAQTDLTSSQINYSQAVYQLIVARYNLKNALKNN